MRHGRVRVAALLLAIALVVGGCANDEDPGPSADGSEHGAMSHVHGIAPGPSGQAFIATHAGLYRLKPGAGSPDLVGETRHDLMGFTRASRDRYLASGHPDPRLSGMPPNFGVIQSRDLGRTWNGIAFYGEADFHVLEAQGRHVYGYDGRSGRLKATPDGRRWSDREPPDEILSLAIDPRSPKRLVAASPGGIAASVDAGARWRPLRRDLVGLLTWPAANRLLLVDGAGAIHLSRDRGRNWRQVGELGSVPTAFEAVGDDVYAALEDGSVQRSADDGATWSVVGTF